MKFGKFLRTPLPQSTSSGCFCQKRLQHRCLPEKFENFLRATFFTDYLRWLLLNAHFSLVRLCNNKNQHGFLACFKDIFDSRILFPELVAERKHYLFGFDAIQFFLSKQYFCLLITTIQIKYISNAKLFKKNIFCTHLKRKTAA